MSDVLSPEDLYDLRTPADVAVSPDGARVAFVVIESDPNESEYRRSLFVAPANGNRDPHRLTRVADVSSPKWGPDGDQLAFLAARDRDIALEVGSDTEDGDAETGANAPDESADDEPKSQVWVCDLVLGGDARQVTDFDEGVREFDWSPGGDRFVVSARDPTNDQQSYLDGIREGNDPYEVTRTQYKKDGEGYLDDVVSYLFVADSDAKGAKRDDSRRLDDARGQGAQEPYAGLQPTWGADGRIAYTAFYGDNPEETYALDIHTITPDGSNRRRLTDGDVTALGLRWSPDGNYLSFSARHPKNLYYPVEVRVADPDDGSIWSVSASLDRTLGLGGVAEWIGGDSLLSPIGDRGRPRLVRFDACDDDPEYLFTPQGSGIAGFDATADTTAVVLSHPNEGVDAFAVPTADIDSDATLTRLSALNDELLTDSILPRCEEIRFENSDSDEVQGLIYLPADYDPGADDVDPLPLICHIHGGPIMYNLPEFNFDYAYWVGQGYAVLNVNYRGSTSVGREFSECIRGKWGPRETDDILSGVDHVVERGWADPDRLFVTGLSQGGINTLHVVTRDDRFAAAAPEHAIYDFYSGFGTTDRHQWYVDDVGVPWENETAFNEMSSIRDVADIDTPLLIAAGENDDRTPPSQAEQLYVSAKRAGIKSKLVIYQDESHGISRPDRAIHRLKSLTSWFGSHDSDGDDMEKTE